MSLLKSSMVLIAALITIILSDYLRPSLEAVDRSAAPDFEKIIPISFESWRVDEALPMVLGDPELESKLSIIYSQNITRTYVNDVGQRIMLSIAYGADQRDSMQVHKPEICYPAQGFVVKKMYSDHMVLDGKEIIIKRLVTEKGPRMEFVTYWVLLGDEVVSTGLDWKIKQLSYGLKGVVPDGLLFRISSIGNLNAEEYSLHNEFAQSLIKLLPINDKQKLIGI